MNEYTIRASSLPTLFDCPSRWYAQTILGMNMPSSTAAHLGTSIHASTAAFDQAKLDGQTVTADDAAGVLVDTLHDKNADVNWRDGDFTERDAESIGLMLHTKYCLNISPQQEYVGVEVTCEKMPVDFPELGVRIILTGTTDRIRMTKDGLGIADLKSGKRAVSANGTVDSAKHGAQMGVYELLAQQATGKPIEAPAQIIGLTTTKDARVGTGEVKSALSVLIGDSNEKGLLDHAAAMLKHDVFPGNPRSQLCSEKFCPAYQICKYRY
jgi:hypothetical protein